MSSPHLRRSLVCSSLLLLNLLQFGGLASGFELRGLAKEQHLEYSKSGEVTALAAEAAALEDELLKLRSDALKLQDRRADLVKRLVAHFA